MPSFRTPRGLDLRSTDVVRIVIAGNPKRPAGKNVAYYDAVANAIAAGHNTVAGIVAATKETGFPILAEIRHNLGRGYYVLERDGAIVVDFRATATGPAHGAPELADPSPAPEAPPRPVVGFGDEPPAENDLATIRRDIAEIESDPTTSDTEREALVRARVGQGQFRSGLFSRWENACAVTGCTVSEVLRASHMKPWRESTNAERLNPCNGLLLVAHLDALFDRYLISFQDDGEMLVSRTLSRADREILGVPQQLRKSLNSEERQFLAVHRRRQALASFAAHSSHAQMHGIGVEP